MGYELLRCPGCGANLPPPEAPNAIMVCAYCGAVLAGSPGAAWAPTLRPVDERPFDPHRPRVSLGGVRYAVMGRLGVGAGSDVFLARRDTRLTELVVLKVARHPDESARLAREHDTLQALQRSEAQGHEHFSRLLPQPVAQGELLDAAGGGRPARASLWRSGYLHTLTEVRGAHPQLDPRAMVWMWKRTLEMLGFVHRAGYVHGAVLPPHLLVHPRDHGVSLVGWSSATRIDRRAPHEPPRPADAAFYPPAALRGAILTPRTDLAMSARCMAWLLGGDAATGATPAHVPEALSALLARSVDPDAPGAASDAWALKDALDAAAGRAFGPPRFVPFTMPGWR